MVDRMNQIIEGTINALSWDMNDKALVLGLYTEDGEDIILNHEKGIKKLLPYLGKRVRVRGQIFGEEDSKRVKVYKIRRVLKPSAAKWLEEDDEYKLSDFIGLVA